MNSTKPAYLAPQKDFPFYEEMAHKFPVSETIAFAFDKKIYTNAPQLRPDLLVHEGTHLVQQERNGMTPDKWWRKYIDDPVFRLTQEVEAYQKQLEYMRSKDRNLAVRYAQAFAKQLSSELYGNIIPLEKAVEVLVYKKPLM